MVDGDYFLIKQSVIDTVRLPDICRKRRKMDLLNRNMIGGLACLALGVFLTVMATKALYSSSSGVEKSDSVSKAGLAGSISLFFGIRFFVIASGYEMPIVGLLAGTLVVQVLIFIVARRFYVNAVNSTPSDGKSRRLRIAWMSWLRNRRTRGAKRRWFTFRRRQRALRVRVIAE